jgi:hypothetical protein
MQASLFSSEHISLASSNSRSFCLARAAANSGSRAAASSAAVLGVEGPACDGAGVVTELVGAGEAAGELGAGDRTSDGAECPFVPLVPFTWTEGAGALVW